MKINNLNWSIKFDENLAETIHGQTNYECLTICIRPQCCKQNQKRTLLHEIVHAYLYSYGLIFEKEFGVETLCEFISHNFYNIKSIYETALKELFGNEM